MQPTTGKTAGMKQAQRSSSNRGRRCSDLTHRLLASLENGFANTVTVVPWLPHLHQLLCSNQSQSSTNFECYPTPPPRHTHTSFTLFKGLYLRDCGSDFHTVFTGGQVRSSYLDHSRIWLIWGGGGTLAAGACRVKGVNIVR